MYDFQQTPGMPWGLKHYSEVVEASECLASLQIFLYEFWKTPGVPGSHKHFSELVEA